jgi:hypothetical protein
MVGDPDDGEMPKLSNSEAIALKLHFTRELVTLRDKIAAARRSGVPVEILEQHERSIVRMLERLRTGLHS